MYPALVPVREPSSCDNRGKVAGSRGDGPLAFHEHNERGIPRFGYNNLSENDGTSSPRIIVEMAFLFSHVCLVGMVPRSWDAIGRWAFLFH